MKLAVRAGVRSGAWKIAFYTQKEAKQVDFLESAPGRDAKGTKAKHLHKLRPRLRPLLAADVDGAEAQDYVSAGGGPAEAQHWAEAREQKRAIQLAVRLLVVRAIDYFISNHLSARIHNHVHQEVVLEDRVGMLHFGHDVCREIGKRNQLGGTQQRCGNVVGIGLHGDTRKDHVQYEYENDDRGEESAGGRNGQRTENIVEQDFGAILDALPATRPALCFLGLRGGNLDAYGKIRRRQTARRTGQQHGKLAIALQFFTAIGAIVQMLAQSGALFRARRGGQRVIQISGELILDLLAGHDFSPRVQLRRVFSSSAENAAGRTCARFKPICELKGAPPACAWVA